MDQHGEKTEQLTHINNTRFTDRFIYELWAKSSADAGKLWIEKKAPTHTSQWGFLIHSSTAVCCTRLRKCCTSSHISPSETMLIFFEDFFFFFSLVNHFWPEFKSFLITKIGVNHATRASLTFSVSQMLLDLSQPSNKVIKSIALQLGETADNIPRACYSGAARCWWRPGEQKVRRWQSGVSRHSRVSRHTTRKVAQISFFSFFIYLAHAVTHFSDRPRPLLDVVLIRMHLWCFAMRLAKLQFNAVKPTHAR